MNRCPWLIVACCILVSAGRGFAEELPLVTDADFAVLRADGQRVQRALAQLKTPLGAADRKSLDALLAQDARMPRQTVARIQKLLDRYCLVGVTINPESRVKAVRGPAAGRLLVKGEQAFLIKVINQAGVTHVLRVSGPQLRLGQAAARGRWLTATVQTARSKRPALSGHAVEYVILRLVAHEPGKREATLCFDAGQGTQDLGFRAEVPILFTVQGTAPRAPME